MATSPPPWPAGTVTGIGSLPGTDPAEAARLVAGELPDLPHLPELPDRGPGADLIGRGAAFLVDLHVDLQPAGWRLVDRPGSDERRARDLLDRDLDAFTEALAGRAGPIKVQAAGPWTLAASVERPRGGPALGDRGAVHELAESLAEGLAGWLAELRRRLPSAPIVLQLDEPSLPAVLAGAVPTPSGWRTLRSVPVADATGLLGRVLAAVGEDTTTLVHCCAARPPLEVIGSAGATAASVDLDRLDRSDEQAIGSAAEAGHPLVLGVVPGRDAALPDPTRTADRARVLWSRIGLPLGTLPGAVVLTPACGLAGASPVYVRSVLAHLRAAATRLVEDPEGELR